MTAAAECSHDATFADRRGGFDVRVCSRCERVFLVEPMPIGDVCACNHRGTCWFDLERARLALAPAPAPRKRKATR